MTLQLKSCCFMSVKKGSYFSAGYTLLFYLMVLTAGTIHIDEVWRDKVMLGFTITLVTLSAFTVLTSILLIIGLQGDTRSLMIPWIFITTLTTILDVILTIYLLCDARWDPFFFVMAILDFVICFANAYCLLCVVSQYREYVASDRRKRQFQNGEEGIRSRSLKPETSEFISTAKSSRVEASVSKSHLLGIEAGDSIRYIDDSKSSSAPHPDVIREQLISLAASTGRGVGGGVGLSASPSIERGYSDGGGGLTHPHSSSTSSSFGVISTIVSAARGRKDSKESKQAAPVLEVETTTRGTTGASRVTTTGRREGGYGGLGGGTTREALHPKENLEGREARSSFSEATSEHTMETTLESSTSGDRDNSLLSRNIDRGKANVTVRTKSSGKTRPDVVEREENARQLSAGYNSRMSGLSEVSSTDGGGPASPSRTDETTVL